MFNSKNIKAKIILSIVFFSLSALKTATAQDTAAMIHDFNKVMSFAVSPYLYYHSSTSVKATPVMQKEDTMNLQGVFYKYDNDLCFKNGKEEMYLEDSFYIQVNHENKTINVSKVDVSTKDKMNVLPLSNKNLQALFRKKFLISREKPDGDYEQLNFESRQYFDSLSMVLVDIALRYSGSTYLPDLLQMNITMKQPLSDADIAVTPENMKNAVETINGFRYITRKQSVTIAFNDISKSKEKARAIPSWKELLGYDEVRHVFVGKGLYSNYEISTTF
ncbi:MAG: hypothetical protein JST86_16375 [Bacteroidetes bacterium]|nr:hypothetical protein [Bacteroidota bacterium]